MTVALPPPPSNNDSVLNSDIACAPSTANGSVASSGLTCRIQPEPSPYLPVHCGLYPLRLTLDSGAEINLIRDTVATLVGATISKTSQNVVDRRSRFQEKPLCPCTVAR